MASNPMNTGKKWTKAEHFARPDGEDARSSSERSKTQDLGGQPHLDVNVILIELVGRDRKFSDDLNAFTNLLHERFASPIDALDMLTFIMAYTFSVTMKVKDEKSIEIATNAVTKSLTEQIRAVWRAQGIIK